MKLPSITDYSVSIQEPQLVKANKLEGGKPMETNGRIIKYSGGFCVVFPFQTNTKKYAVRCWHVNVSDAQMRAKRIAEALSQSGLPYFVDFEYVEQGIATPLGIQPVVIMDWVEAKPLKQYLSDNYLIPSALNKLANNFMQMVSDLHKCHFSHGDLQHGNIMIRDDGSIVLVDYDSMYVPSLQGMPEEIKGLHGYQHEARWTNKILTEKADYFSELVIYLSIKALEYIPKLWEDLNLANTETMLFSDDDIKSKGSSSIFSVLKTNDTLKPLVEVLCDFMNRNSLDDLEPLESIAKSSIETISNKWQGGNGYTHVKQDTRQIRNSIFEKWKRN